jgi:hypothetical protein
MPNPKPYARIAITLPPETLRAADELAARMDRSRSWIIAEAIRQYAAREGTWKEVDPGFVIGASRLEQLRRDAMLSPEARVRESEEISAIGGAYGIPTAPRTFASYDAFQAWLDQRESR